MQKAFWVKQAAGAALGCTASCGSLIYANMIQKEMPFNYEKQKNQNCVFFGSSVIQ